MHQIIINTGSIAFVLEFGSQFLGEKYDEFAIKKFSAPLINPQDPCPYRNRFEKPLKRLFSEYTKRKDGYTWAIQGLLYELFAMIVRYIPMEQNTEKQKRMSRYLKIQKAFNLIHEKYSQKLTVTAAATYVGYDSRSFCRLFKFITNETFHDYLNFYRINIAMQLLQHREYSISEVALMVGIPVAKTFSRLFRKYTQMTPSKYRNRYLITPETQD
jgi:AraC-like DNA-binding protein